MTPPPVTVSLAVTARQDGSMVFRATTNYNVDYSGLYVQIWDVGNGAWISPAVCSQSTVCTAYPFGPYVGPFMATVSTTLSSSLPVQGLVASSLSVPSLLEVGGATSALTKCPVCNTADPVNTATGALVESADDVSISGRGPGLVWRRTYVSSLAGTDGPLGYGWNFDYGAHLALTPSSDPLVGSKAVFVDGGGARVTFTQVGGGSWFAAPEVQASLVQNADGSFTLTRAGSGRVWQFSSTGVLTAVNDRSGLATTLGYDGSGNLTTVTDEAGRQLTVAWSGGHIHTVTDPLGRVTTYGYDTAGDLTSVTDGGGRVTQYSYNSDHTLATMTDPYGGTTTNTYTSGKVTEQVDPTGIDRTWTYSGNPAGWKGTTTMTTTRPGASTGQTTTWLYHFLQLASQTTAAGTTTYAYDAHLNRTDTIDPAGNDTHSTYDSAGNVLTQTDPSGVTVTYTYDSMGHRTSQTWPSGIATLWSYQVGGVVTNNLQTVTTMNGTTVTGVTTYTYGDPAHPSDATTITDPDGRAVTLTYDADGNVATRSVTDVHSVTSTGQSMHDADGQLVCSVSPVQYAAGVRCPTTGPAPAGAATITYDGSGRVTATTDALGQTTTRAYSGHTTTTTDASGHVTVAVTDADLRVVSATTGSGTSTAATTTTGYDLAPGTSPCPATTGVLWCDTSTDPTGKTSVTEYDSAGRVIASIQPGGATTTTAYDTAGRASTVTAPDGSSTTMTYDPAGRILTRTASTGSPATVTYTYNGDGQRATMTQATSPTSTTTYTYGPLGLLASVDQTQGSTTSTISYGRDQAGHITSITYPDGRVVQQNIDTAGLVNQLTDTLSGTTRTFTFGYDQDGNLTSTTLPGSAATLTSQYDATNLATSTSVSSGSTTLLSLTYGRTNTGLISSETATGSATSGGTYGYTSNNQLASAGTDQYGYDLAGRPTTLPGGTQTFSTTTGQIATSTVGGTNTTFTFNANGDLVTAASDVTTAYGYNQTSQMTSSQSTPGPQTTYTYDGDGLRASKTTNGVTTAFVYDVSGSVPRLLTDGTNDYIYGPAGTVIEQVATATNTPTYLVADQHGDTRALLDATGAVTATWTYSPYGQATQTSGSATTPLLYGGGYLDTETGLIYLIHRYYDPGTAQFTTLDPLVALTGDPYGYVNDNPLNLTDLAGLWDWGQALGVVAAVAGVVAVAAAVVAVTVAAPEIAVIAAGVDTYMTYTSIAAGAAATGYDCIHEGWGTQCGLDLASTALGGTAGTYAHLGQIEKISEEARLAGEVGFGTNASMLGGGAAGYSFTHTSDTGTGEQPMCTINPSGGR